MKKIIMVFLILSTLTFSKNINVGDRIGIEVKGVSKNQIVDGFKNSKFELESVEKQKDGGYRIYFRTFNTGENSCVLGNKKITIETKSLITEKDREIYRDLKDLSNKKLYISKFPYLSIISAILGVLSLVYIVKKVRFKWGEKTKNPEEQFEERMANLSDNWAYEISLAVREYIDVKKGTHFVNGFYEKISKITDEDIKFLRELDEYKFSKDEEDLEKESIQKAREIFEKLRGEADV